MFNPRNTKNRRTRIEDPATSPPVATTGGMRPWRTVHRDDPMAAQLVDAIMQDRMGSIGYTEREDGTIRVWATARKIKQLEQQLF
jgi:hypothetical protein